MNETKDKIETSDNHKIIKYSNKTQYECHLAIENLTIDKGVKDWNFSCDYPTNLAIYSNEGDNLTNIVNGLSGTGLLASGSLLVNQMNVTYSVSGWDRGINYVDFRLKEWNKLFSVQHNLARYAMKNKNFLQEISNRNIKIKTAIANLKNSGLSLDSENFKIKLLSIIKAFISETETTRNLFIKEYEFQINNFHEEFAKTKFTFQGSETLTPILIRKFNAEEENIIANNNLLFFQSLQDRISSLENLVGKCSCGCNPSKEQEKNFRLREIIYVLAEINIFLNAQVANARKDVKTTLKSCNNYNQIFNAELNKTLSYNKVNFSRSKIEQIIEEWVDLAEMQRIKFNMKQDFVAMQLLPDEMNLLLKNIREEIKVYHHKLLTNPTYQNETTYQHRLSQLQNQLIDVRDLISENMMYIFQALNLVELMGQRYSNLTLVQRRLINVLQQLIVVTKIIILDNPFALLEKNDRKLLAGWLQVLAEQLKIIIIFTSQSEEDIKLLASDICIIENEVVIQQGKVADINTNPLSLSLLKEMNKKQLNIFNGKLENGDVIFYQNKLGNFPQLKTNPIIAFKASDIIFTYKKPAFSFLYKIMLINGNIKNINKINSEEALLTFETFSNDLFEVLISVNNNYVIGSQGWVIFKKHSIYIFNSETNKLVGTW